MKKKTEWGFYGRTSRGTEAEEKRNKNIIINIIMITKIIEYKIDGKTRKVEDGKITKWIETNGEENERKMEMGKKI